MAIAPVAVIPVANAPPQAVGIEAVTADGVAECGCAYSTAIHTLAIGRRRRDAPSPLGPGELQAAGEEADD